MRPVGPPPSEFLASAQAVRIPSPSRPPKAVPTAERQEFGIRLGLEYGGKPFLSGNLASVGVTLFDSQEFKTRKMTFPAGADQHLIPDLLPGTFSCQVMIDADPSNPPGFPGDYRGQAYFFRGPQDDAPVRIPLLKHLRLLEPADNNELRDGGMTVTGTVRVAWDPLPEVEEYRVTLAVRPQEWPREFLATSGSSVEFDVAPNLYSLHVEGVASKTTVAVGLYQFKYSVDTPFGPRVPRNQVGYLPLRVNSLATSAQDVSTLFWYDNGRLTIPATAGFDVRVFPKFASARIEADIDRSPSSFTIRNLPPGPYRMEVRVDLNPENPPGMPGDLFGTREFTVPAGRREYPTVFLTSNIRLLYPEDTNDPLLAGRIASGAFPKVKSPLVIAWQPVEGAALYRYSLNPPYVYGSTSATSLVLQVPGGAVTNVYLDAYSASGSVIGKLRLDGLNQAFPIFVEALPESPLQPSH